MSQQHTEEALLTLDQAGVSYKKCSLCSKSSAYWALNDISFSLYRGETLGVIGRNGAGKSTLLRLLAGINKPDKGTIKNNNCKISLLTLQAGFIPQLTGRENAILSGMLLGISKKVIKSRMHEIMDFSELGEFIDQPISSYSTGMRARLGFSVAIQIDPDVLLIDEVLGVGDAVFRKKSSDVIRQRIRSNKTVVLVSHDQQTISKLCDRAVWIDKGYSKAEGDTKAVLKAYTRT